MTLLGLLIIFGGGLAIGIVWGDELRVFVRGPEAEARRHDDLAAKLMRQARAEWE